VIVVLQSIKEDIHDGALLFPEPEERAGCRNLHAAVPVLDCALQFVDRFLAHSHDLTKAFRCSGTHLGGLVLQGRAQQRDCRRPESREIAGNEQTDIHIAVLEPLLQMRQAILAGGDQ
jgi:hypothetical protein